MEKYTFITNNCLGLDIYKKINIEYTNPFIGSYFQDDHQFVKFCTNYDYYIKLKPEFKDPLLPIDTNNSIIPPNSFPVMFLGDIEIHWIHEKDKNKLIEKYNRRLERTINKVPIFIWGDILNHRFHEENEYNNLVSAFLNISVKNRIYLYKKDFIKWSNQSMEDRHINNGWAQPLKWSNNTDIINIILTKFDNYVLKDEKYSK